MKKKKTKGKEQCQKKLYLWAALSLIIGLIIGFLIPTSTIANSPSIIKTYCDINMQTLYEKPCTATEDCYGRLELCSVSLKKCMTTVDVDKTDIRNIRIPDNQPECERNGGEWKVEIIPEE